MPNFDVNTDEWNCHHEGCDEVFDEKVERLRHSMREHWDVNPKKYPNMTEQDDGLLF